MKRLAKALLAALLIPACLTSSAHAAEGFVHRDGTRIVDGSGTPIKPNGVNIGGYLMWEGWIIGGAATAETPMVNRLEALVGKQRADEFRQQMRDSFITRADFEQMKGMGIDTVRVPFNHRLLDEDADGGFKTLDRLVADARATGLHLVLDLHGAQGGQNPLFISDPDMGLGTMLWGSAAAQDATVALWRKVAARYADEPVIAGYDLLNEPAAPSAAKLTGLYGRIIAAIRQVDPNHLLFVEGNDYAHDLSGFTRMDDNLAFSFHQYPLDTGDPDKKVDEWVAAAQAADVPLWNGEYGQSNYANVADQMQRFRSRPEVDGQTLWTWKLADRNLFFAAPAPTAPAPVKFVVSDEWMDVVRYLTVPAAAKPSPDRAEAGLQSFIAASTSGRTIPDQKMASTLRGDGAATSTPAATPAAPATAAVTTTVRTVAQSAASASAVVTAKAIAAPASTVKTTASKAKAAKAAKAKRAKAKRAAAKRRAAKARKAKARQAAKAKAKRAAAR